MREYLRAAARERAAIHRGDPGMPREEITRRHAVCRSNECGRYLPDVDRCAECGCSVAKKVAWRTASCPLGRWPALSPVTEPPAA